MVPAQLTGLLLDLTERAQPLSNTGSLDEYQNHAKELCNSYQLSLQQLQAVRSHCVQLNSACWGELAEAGVVAADVVKTLTALMRYGPVLPACTAAVVYSLLLKAPEAPVHNLLDTSSFAGALQCTKEATTASNSSSSKSSKGKGSSKHPKASQIQKHSQAIAEDSADEDEGPFPGPSTAASNSHLPQFVSAEESEVSTCLCVEALANLAAMAQQVQLRSYGELLQAGLEGCTDLLGCTKAAKVPTSSKGLGLFAGSVSTAAYALLGALFNPRHGDMLDMATMLLPRLTPFMVGAGPVAAAKRSPTETATIRTAALDFVRASYSRHPEIKESVAALVRHICLKAQDKADSRAAAIKACTELVPDLPQWEQEQFVGFVYNLSRAKQVGLRTLSVGLANSLLTNLPEPFTARTFLAAAGVRSSHQDSAPAQPSSDASNLAGAAGCSSVSGSSSANGMLTATPAPTQGRPGSERAVRSGMVQAPWSVVALAVLLHRCSDKSAAVRARALADLAEVVDTFSHLLAAPLNTEQHLVAEAFVEGLGAAAALQAPDTIKPSSKQGSKRKNRAGTNVDDDSYITDDELETAGAAGNNIADDVQHEGPDHAAGANEAADAGNAADSEQQWRARRQQHKDSSITFVAYIPAQLTAELSQVMALVQRRCGDSKAAVRKGALQLLEALLVMRASWQGYPRQLPGSGDLALLEAATSDPLVSVRKAALVALSTLLELFPCEPSLCQAWVASGLPLVRDVEASIQECLADWAAALLLDKAADFAAAKSHSKTAAGGSSRPNINCMEIEAVTDDTQTDAAAAFGELRPLLAAVAGVGRAAGACLGKLCAGMAVNKRFKAGAVAKGLEAVIAGTPAGSPAALGAWLLLKEVAAQESAAPSWQFLQQRWAAVRNSAAETCGVFSTGANDGAGQADEAASLLLVISHTAAGFPAAQAQPLAAELLQHILSFNLPPLATGAHIAALYKLTATSAESGSSSSDPGAPEQWVKLVFIAGHELLRRYIDTKSSSLHSSQVQTAAAVSDATACVAMFTMGELAVLKACKPPSGLTVLLQALTARKLIPAATQWSESESQLQLQSQLPSWDELSSHSTQDGADAQLPEKAVAAGVNVMQADTAVIQGDAGGDDGRVLPGSVQGHAWIALGKVCLVDEGMAKKCVPLFVQELGRSPLPVVRNNIMVALSDMLIQYTALVDAHMPKLAACIRDPHGLVRRQALALLANLLMKDYVKWRGPLFHRFLLALVDPLQSVRQLAEYLLRDTLVTKAPLLAYNHFVEALFVLNGCATGLHASTGGVTMSQVAIAATGGSSLTGLQDGAAGSAGSDDFTDGMLTLASQFTLKGRQNRPARDAIYSALLRSMSPEHKFSSAAKLCSEVLAAVADGLLPLCEYAEVLRDALCLMASKDIKVSASRLAAPEDDEPTMSQTAVAAGSATAAEAAARARGKLVSTLMKRHLVEQVVPVLVELRRLLAEVKHPLLVELMCCFASLLKEYKGEVEDILVADKQLAKEILFDIKQADLAKAQQNLSAANAAAPAAAGPRNQQDARSTAAAGFSNRASPLPAGVAPGTPIAAEVLKTAERLHRQQQQQQQGIAAAAAEAGIPNAASPSLAAAALAELQTADTAATAAHTASKSQLLHGSNVAAAAMGATSVFKTPAAKTPHTGLLPATSQRLAPRTGARGSLGLGLLAGASPAPLTVPKSQAGAAAGADGANGNLPPSAAQGGRVPGAAPAARSLHRGTSPIEPPTNILLPSPYRHDPPRQWNIPEYVATGGQQQRKQQQQQQQAACPTERLAGNRNSRAIRAVRGRNAAAAAGAGSGSSAESVEHAAEPTTRPSRASRAANGSLGTQALIDGAATKAIGNRKGSLRGSRKGQGTALAAEEAVFKQVPVEAAAEPAAKQGRKRRNVR